MRLFLLVVVLTVPAVGASAQTSVPPAAMQQSLQQWQQYIVVGPNVPMNPADGVPLYSSSPSARWFPDNGIAGGTGILSAMPSQGGPLRLDFAPTNGSLGGVFYRAWGWLAGTALRVFVVLLAFVIGLNMAKRYIRWGR